MGERHELAHDIADLKLAVVYTGEVFGEQRGGHELRNAFRVHTGAGEA